ncbi:MAG: hypothetical protein R3D67_11860 [Hyphomicrobiaceae bacterium]
MQRSTGAQFLVVEAIEAALADTGIEAKDVDGVVSDGLVMPTTVPLRWAAQFGFERAYDGGMSFGGAANACAPIHAQLAIDSGLATTLVYCWRGLGTRSSGPYGFHDLYAAKMAFEKPYGFTGQPQYFALWARAYMHEYGLTERDLATIAVTQRESARLVHMSQAARPPDLRRLFRRAHGVRSAARAGLLPDHGRRLCVRHDQPRAGPKSRQTACARAGDGFR